MADDTVALLRHLGIAQYDVFGYSIGGTVALGLALRHPGVARRLVLSSAVYSLDGYHTEFREGLNQLTAEVLPPQMRETYERVAPHPDHWPRLVAKVAEQARSYGGADPKRSAPSRDQPWSWLPIGTLFVRNTRKTWQVCSAPNWWCCRIATTLRICSRRPTCCSRR